MRILLLLLLLVLSCAVTCALGCTLVPPSRVMSLTVIYMHPRLKAHAHCCATVVDDHAAFACCKSHAGCRACALACPRPPASWAIL